MTQMLSLLAILALIGSGPAAAQSVKSVLEDFGYIGRWSATCDQPDKPFFTVSVRSSGVAEYRVHMSADDIRTTTILGARRTGADQITIKLRLASGKESEWVVVRTGNSVRTMSNRHSDGTIIAKDGVVVASGNPTLPATRCR